MNTPHQEQHQVRRRQLIFGLVLALGTFVLSTQALPAPAERITLDQNIDVPRSDIRGLTDINVVAPFDGSAITLLINDAAIATKVRPPYLFSVDLGADPIERKLTVRASAKGRQAEWSRIINRGKLPLTITLHAESDALVADTTASADDPITSVDFYDGNSRIASVTVPPYRVPYASVKNIVVATARTRSGVEAAATWSGGINVHTEQFDVRTVPLFVSVVDQNGATRVDLTSRDFRIFDKGREAKLLEFGKAYDQPVSIAVLLDASASMNYRMRDVANAAKRFVGSLDRPDDQFAVFTIRSVPRREQALTRDADAVNKAISGIEASGETALYDAVFSALRELRDEKSRRAIVVLSDGEDTASNRSFDELLKEAKESSVPIYAIAFTDGNAEATRGLEQLRLLTAETGGFLTIADATKLDAKYREIANDLRAQYAIKYQIADNTASGEWRPVKVVVDSPKLSARTIRGYFAP